LKTQSKIATNKSKFDVGDFKLILYSIVFVSVFLFSIETLKASLLLLGERLSNQIIGLTTNNFVALFIGLMATVILQSSSTVTSALVGAVGSKIIDFDSAMSMMMGANLGTTLTCMMISLSYVSQRLEFKRALEAALVHNIFNLFTILVLFPLELTFKILSKLSIFLTSYIFQGKESINLSFAGLGDLLTMLSSPLQNFISHPVLLLLLSIAMILGSITGFGYLTKHRVFNSVSLLEQRVFGAPWNTLLWGVGITAVLQSSSLATSLVIPLVASGRITLLKALPFVLGANVGTTLTALLATVNSSETAVALAISHVLFNLIGVVLFFPIKPMRMMLIWVARYMGGVAFKHRIWGFIYLIVMFFVMPFILIYVSR
jgi:sodium-dependent phosphate cotransporter